jgi:outer membrane immunogenic protein
MKKLLLAASCLTLTSAASMAADLPMVPTKSPVVAAPAFTWTGCYVGAHAGGGTLTANTEGVQNGRGAVAGGQAGCNYQDGSWVFGVEGEGYWSGISTTNAFSVIPNTFNPSTTETVRTTTSNRNDFTIAARAGITFDRTLIYGKGGWAWGAYRVFETDICCTVGATTTGTFAQSGTLDGFLVGAGIEHALTRNWTVKFEYNFIAFGAKELATTTCLTGVCAVTGTSSISSNKQVFKIGANYLFDVGGAPLVAKY